MLKKLTLSLVVFLVMASLTFGQNALEQSKHKIQKVDPSQETILNNTPVKANPTVSADLFTTDYDYACNNSRPTMLWPYDVDADDVLDPIGVGMQRQDAGVRSVNLFAGLSGEFTWFPVNDPTKSSGWGGVQSITEGPWAGKALTMYHQGGQANYSLVDLETFNLDVTHQALGGTNFPTFVSLADGTILWATDGGDLYKSTDQLANSALVTNVIPAEATDAPAELLLKRSPDGQYVFHPAAFGAAGAGQVEDPIVEQDSSDFVSLLYSTDGGANFTFEKVGYAGWSIISNRPNYQPLFANFAQLDGAVDNSGKMHVVINGYSVDYSTADSSAVFPVYYWNSVDKDWMAITAPEQEAMDILADNLYPGNGIGNAYPSVSVSEDGKVVFVAYQSPEFNGSDLNLYPGDGGDASAPKYYTDVYYTMSVDGGKTFSAPAMLAGEPNTSDVFPYVSPKGLEYLGDDMYRVHYIYLVDAIPGTSLFADENGASNDSYWVFDSMDFEAITVGVEDASLTVDNFALAQNYPNPFNPTTKISYSVAEQTMVTLKVYDVLGKEVATLVNDVKTAGQHNVSFNAANLATGMYIYKLQAGDFVTSKKMMLVK